MNLKVVTVVNSMGKHDTFKCENNGDTSINATKLIIKAIKNLQKFKQN